MTEHSSRELDVAVVGAGAAGTYLAYRLIQARPDWRIGIFERSTRIGGRLWSVKVDGLAHPIELGGMRYMSGHRLVQSVVDELGIETRSFDPAEEPERTFLRGVIGRSPDDPEGGRGYDLPAGEAGRSAADLMRGAFLEIVPQARELDEAGWRRHRATATFGGRALTDWSIAEAVATILSPEGHRFTTDTFGYDSGIHPHNAGDAIQYIMGTGYPSGKARVPVDGMDRIPSGARDAVRGAVAGPSSSATTWRRVEIGEGSVLLGFADGSGVRARRLVLTLPIPALEALAEASPLINGPTWRSSVPVDRGLPGNEALLLVRPSLVARRRRRPDRPPDDHRPAEPEDLLLRRGASTDRPRSSPPSPTTATTSRSSRSPTAGVGERQPHRRLLEALRGWLAAAHPGAEVPALPTGSAFQHWGADPREVGWHFWRAGANSDEMIDLAAQPDPSLQIHLCGEVFTRRGAWVEGALETADAVVGRLLSQV